MCGRFTQKLTWKEIVTLYRLTQTTPALNLRPRYNGCPTQDFAACRLDRNGERTAVMLRWGLVPGWAKDLKMSSRLINARAETVHEKPAFRSAFRRRRCLVPADGWLEWRKEAHGKQPYFVAAASEEPMSFAGLWERWERGEEAVESFTILTTAASTGLADLHHRQPSIVAPGDFEEWLEPSTGLERVVELARRPNEGPFERRRVSVRVNNPRNDGPELLEALGP